MFGQRVILRRYYRKAGSSWGFEAVNSGNSKIRQRVANESDELRGERSEDTARITSDNPMVLVLAESQCAAAQKIYRAILPHRRGERVRSRKTIRRKSQNLDCPSYSF
jgi:hypothetical protein